MAKLSKKKEVRGEVFRAWVDKILQALNLPLDLAGVIQMASQQGGTTGTTPPADQEVEASIPMQPPTPD